ncbi:MAG: HlyC/CorC family transporter [Muribaculaceae bacterium]|nr:HlyC/CorC family transporter [Muribaculaceae bacterium]
MTLATAIVITVIALVLSALFSGSEIAFVQSDKVRMEIDAAGKGVIDRILRRFSHHEEVFISTMLVGNNIVLVIYGITFGIILQPIFSRWFNNEALVLIVNTLVSTGVVLLAGEFLPKTVFRINPNFMIRIFALPLYLVYWLLYPVSLLVSGISKGLMKMVGIGGEEDRKQGLTIEELDTFLQDQIESLPDKGEIENEVKIFSNAIDFKDTQISECMIPRNEIVAVDIEDMNREDLIKKFIATGLSKIVVYREDIDDVLGYIHISELFNVNAELKKKLKPVIFTPETMLANKMMRRMLNEKKSMTIVVDEYGGTAGLVTVEDLVEEIFGEIEDEHDHNKVLMKEISPGVYEVSGRAEIENINEKFGLDLDEDEDYHTIGGLVLKNSGELPEVGYTFTTDSFRFTVIKMSAARIELVRIERLAGNKN